MNTYKCSPSSIFYIFIAQAFFSTSYALEGKCLKSHTLETSVNKVIYLLADMPLTCSSISTTAISFSLRHPCEIGPLLF